ncbi:amino acid-binding protein [Motiliproteus coralliicola]|uniref:Amino acid-binding protein n=1 Tax=Motiliproteus coralliicola TaxID=2283196 RepID=A0A369WLT3_9GAMM|nr:transporter substrate-binding domain-containing protein [Motiliproteus coralliicola]RDE22672.1 amino acid-binding protein [Motiliproteus coralliicola]
MLFQPARFILAALLFQPFLVQAEECTRVVATAHPDYPPYQWFDGQQMRGASIEINRIIFAELGIPFSVIYTGPWKRVLHAAQQGQVDLVMALKKTPARQEFLNFTSAPILPNPFAVFVERSQVFDFNQWDDLKGKMGGKNAGDRYGAAFDQFSSEQLALEEADTPQTNYRKLIAGRIDYFIHSRYSGATYLHTHPEGDRVIALEKNINEGFIHSGFSRLSPCYDLLPYLNRRYREMMSDGSALQLLESNLVSWQRSTLNQD